MAGVTMDVPGAARAVVSGVVFVAYPLVIYAGLSFFGVREAGLIMLLLLSPVLVSRLRRMRRERLGTLALVPVITGALLAAGALVGRAGFMLAVPTVTNLLLFAFFVPTLRSGPPMIERFARMTHPDLRPAEVRWCRAWTVVWCAFFVMNGAVAAGLALYAPLTWWTLHTSLIGYVLMGALLGGEWVARKVRFRRFGENAFERFLARATGAGEA
jgi:uncharacterized membrane protein